MQEGTITSGDNGRMQAQVEKKELITVTVSEGQAALPDDNTDEPEGVDDLM